MRQSSSRIHRSKGGFRLKHVLQICLLLAICTWLIYQVKHSHDKKKAYEERISKISIKGTEKDTELFDFGRKGLPLANNNGSISANLVKDEDGDEGEQVGDEEAKRDGDDGVIELDEDRGDGENEQEEEFAGEDEKDGQAEEDALFDHEEREDSAQEAREENYKRDDASSAVAHDVEDPKSFNGEQVVEDPQSGNVDNTTNTTNVTYDDGSNNSKNTTLDHTDSTNNVSTTTRAFNGSFSDSKLREVESTKSENGTISTLASTEGGNQIMELQSNTTMAALAVNNLEIAGTPAVNVSDTSSEYQNSIKLDEKSELGSPVQDLNSAVNEISKEVDKISDKNEGQEAEIHHPNSTVIEA